MVAVSDLDLPLLVFQTLFVELHSFDCDWCGTLLEGRSEVHVLRDDSFVEKCDHTLVNVIFSDGGWVLSSFVDRRESLFRLYGLGVLWLVAFSDGGQSAFQDSSRFVVWYFELTRMRGLAVKL